MGLAEQYAADLARLIAERPTEFGYRKQTFRALRSKLSSEFTLGDFGVVSGYRFSLRALCSDLPQIPEEGEVVSVGAVDYRIMNPVEVDALGISVLLHLGGYAG